MICGKKVPDSVGGGYLLCESCWPNTVSMSEFTRPALSTIIDHAGTIWTGMPDDPEPDDIHLTDLPIWHEHPDRACFRRIPFSKFQEQYMLRMRCTWGKKQAQTQYKRPIMYTCFVCGKQHDAMAAPEEPLMKLR